MNKKIFIFFLLVLAVFFSFVIAFLKKPVFQKNIQNVSQNNQPLVQENISSEQVKSNEVDENNSAAKDFQSPLDFAPDRVIKKPFGIYITPKNSPVQPEKFQGYHTGTDFEIFPDELTADVSVKAVCSGKILLKKTASGYGGVIAESCELDKNPITVIYGHLKLASISKNLGESISAGETLGILGANKSVETDGERKHLHLGFHKGIAVNILGYVQNKSTLSDWINPCLYVCY